MSQPSIRKSIFGGEPLSRLDAIYNTALWFNKSGRDTQDLVVETYDEVSRIRDWSFSKANCRILMFKVLMKELFGDVRLDFFQHVPDYFEDKGELFPTVDISEIKNIPAQVVAKVIKSLPLEIQLVVFLSNLKIFTYAEIAQIFGISREDIRLNIYHGYNLIRRDLFNYATATNIGLPIKIKRAIRRRKGINDDRIRGAK